MQIKTTSSIPWNHSAHDQSTASNTGYRNKRSIDSSAQADQQLVQEVRPAPAAQGGGYTEVSVDPDPGKGVDNSQKVPIPIDVGLNINVDPVAKHISSAFKTVEQEASDFLKEKFAELKNKDPANKEKWDIDPDNTYLVTYDYNSLGKEPYPAKVIQRTSLTQALIKNTQDTPTGKGYEIPFFAGGPNVKTQDSLPMNSPGIFDFSTRFSPYREGADVTHTYQGIYVESPGSPSQEYNATNQSSITPKEFKSLIWQADFQQPYTDFLDGFWSTHIEKYPVLAKASFVKSAMAQHQEGSLTTEGRELIMRAAGLSGNQESWPDITYDDLQKNPPKDPNIEVGLLKLGEYQSTDIMYITDHKVKFDSEGNRIPPLTLLYIPGNSSPIHSFNSQAEMKKWLARQMADPAKRDALASHFKLEDKPNGWGRAGIDETLIGLGTWPKTRETPGGILSYDHRAFTGKWDPEKFITTEPNNLPFQEVTKRQKDRSYADAAVKITSDRDVTKKNVIDGLTKASKVALFLTPLALVVPEVALALDAFYLTSGGVTASIGVDDKIHNKSTGTDRIVFGLFNAATVVIPKSIGKAREQSIGEIKAPKDAAPSPDQELAPGAVKSAKVSGLPRAEDYGWKQNSQTNDFEFGHSSKPTNNTDEVIVPSKAQPTNNLRPSQAGHIGEHAVQDGENLLKNIKPNNGIYHIKGSQGEDRWLIQYSDDTNVNRVYEIDGRFKLRDGYVNIIDPANRKPVMKVSLTASEVWKPMRLDGGIRPLNTSPEEILNEEIKNINKDRDSLSDVEKTQFSDQMTSLIQQSRAEDSQIMTDYIEAGSKRINSRLRKQQDSTKYSRRVKEFMTDFSSQADYHGPAYRYTYVSPAGKEALKSGVGKVFRGPAVQSSSTHPANVKGWSTWAEDNPLTQNNPPAIYVFDESVPKKNLSSGFLLDHVAVPPDTSLKVLATKEQDGILYVYFGAPTETPTERYNLFDGSVVNPT